LAPLGKVGDDQQVSIHVLATKGATTAAAAGSNAAADRRVLDEPEAHGGVAVVGKAIRTRDEDCVAVRWPDVGCRIGMLNVIFRLGVAVLP
jgi:hypothetical protein